MAESVTSVMGKRERLKQNGIKSILTPRTAKFLAGCFAFRNRQLHQAGKNGRGLATTQVGGTMQIGTLDGAALIDASRTETLDDVLTRVCNISQLSATQFSLAENH